MAAFRSSSRKTSRTPRARSRLYFEGPKPQRVADDGVLLIRQHLGLDLGDAKTRRDGVRRRPIVAGQHDDLDAFGGQCRLG